MPQYAHYDHTAASPARVTGWFDTDALSYPSLPSSADLLPLTTAQWDARLADPNAWAVSGGTLMSYTPPMPTPPTLAQQAVAALAAPYTITDTGTPADGGTYTIDATALAHINAEVTSLILNSVFTDGTATVAWPDTSGAVHTFTVEEFKVFATAVGSYVAALYKCVNGVSTTLPAAAVAIA